MNCRHCNSELRLPFLDLGSAPLSNAYLSREQLRAPEKWYPLRVLACDNCWLVQTEDYAGADEIFTADYAYFSSISSTWLDHAERYVAQAVKRFALGPDSLVVEVAANDGYLLQYVKARGIPCLGIEPTRRTAEAARQKGIPIIEDFFSDKLACELVDAGRRADLVIANNVLAHVPDINDFVAAVARLLKASGIATFEFPHLLNLVQGNQFDTVYHEHYSYLSLTSVVRIFRVNGLRVVDVEIISTHGGSIRVYAQRDDAAGEAGEAVEEMLAHERRAGVTDPKFYAGLQSRADAAKHALLSFLLEQKKAGRKVGAYGAAAKGNTLLNFSGVRPDLLPYVVDRSPGKQHKFLPGSRIPIVNEDYLFVDKPDWVLILPWNLRSEIELQLAAIRDWGGKFVMAMPKMEFQ